MVRVSSEIKKAGIYIPGLSIEEIKKKYSLKTVYKLGSNENPLPPPEGLLKALRAHLPKIHRYPSYTRPVVSAVARYYNKDPQEVVLGNGSSELIDKLIQTYGAPDGMVLMSKNTFPLYALCARAHRLPIYKVGMDPHFKVSVKKILRALRERDRVRLIFISNPNNPTGSYITNKELDLLLSETRNKNLLVVVDEAYFEYARAKDFPNSLHLMKKYSHLVLLRSMSKVMGLAGLRAGVLLARPAVTKHLQKVICPFNVNTLSARAMLYCVSNPDFKKYLSDSKKQVWKGLDYFYSEFTKMGLSFYPSQGNFVLFSPGRAGGFAFFIKKGLILRPMREAGLKNFLRMSVGREHENKKAIQLIKSFCVARRLSGRKSKKP